MNSYNIKSFRIKSFRGGISDYSDKGIAGSFKFGNGLDIRKNADTLSCQQTLAAEGGGIITDLILFSIPASDGNSYGFGDSGKIYKRTSAGIWSLVYTDAGGKIKGAAEWFDNTGQAYLYFATDIALKKKPLPGLSNWSDVASVGTLSSTDWHTMQIINGSLMICNDNKLAMVGYDNSFTASALDLIPGNIAKTLIERGEVAAIGSIRKDDSYKGHLWAWTQTALNWIKKKEIPAKGVNALIDTEMTIMQAGSDGDIYFSDFVNMMPIIPIPGGGKANPGGVANDRGLALFGIFGGTNPGIYSYGRKKKNQPIVLNLEYPLTCDEIGSVVKVGSDTLMSYKSGATYGVKKVDTANKGVGIYQSLELKAPDSFAEQTIWQDVKLATMPLSSGTKIAIAYRIDKNGAFIDAKLEGGGTEFTTANETEAIFLIGAEGKIFEFQITLTPLANISPEILNINVFFD